MWAERTAVLILILAGLLSGCVRQDAEVTPPAPEPAAEANYTTMVLEPADAAKESTLSVSPFYDVSVELTAEEPLIFLELMVSRNARVEQGQPLIRLSRGASQADVTAAELALQRAQERLNEDLDALEASLAGETDPLRAQLIALDLEEAALNGSREIASQEQALADARARLEDVVLTAPFDGFVGSVVSLDPGARVDAGTPLMTLNRADSLLLLGNSNVDFFQYGMEVTVEYGNGKNKKTAAGRVVATDKVLGDLVPETGNIYIRLEDSDIPAEKLERASAKVLTPQMSGEMLVPRSAVRTEKDRSFVNILEDGVVQKRYIIPGATVGSQGSYQVQVLSGLEFGQTLVLD